MNRRRITSSLYAAFLSLLAAGCLRSGYDELPPSPGSQDGGAGHDGDASVVESDSGGQSEPPSDAGAQAGRGGGAGAGAGDTGGVAGTEAADGGDAGGSGCTGPTPSTRLIAISGAQVSGPPHADFPLLFSLSASWLTNFAAGGSVFDIDGRDIHFSEDSDDAVPLDHQIEFYDSSAGTLVAWVKIPSLTAETTLYVHAGDCAFTTPPERAGRVWSGYLGVWHLHDALDATANPHDCTSAGNVVPVPGKIAGGMDFDAMNGALTAGADPDLSDVFQGGGVVSAWIKPNGSGEGSLGRIVSKAQPSTPTDLGWSFFIDPAGSGSVMFKHSFGATSAGHWRAATSDADYGRWHAVVVQYRNDSASEVPSFFVDGHVSVGGIYETPSGAADSDSASELRIGNLIDGSRTFDGIIDEVRIARGVHTPEWFETEYNNQNDPASFYEVTPP